MTPMGFDRLRAEILTQTDLLRSHVKGVDLSVPVPSCPGWNLGQLLRHVGWAHRWAETIVRTRSPEAVSDARLNDVAGYTDEDMAVVGPWLTEGAELLAAALRDAGPGAAVWTPVPGETSPAFWARRMTHETAVHRADAASAAGVEFTVAEDVAFDALDEWMSFGSVPEAFAPGPGVPALLGPGRTLSFRATGTAPGTRAHWRVDLTGNIPVWSRAPGDATVVVSAPPADLVLFVYGRPAAGGGPEVTGDAALLELWRERTGFWLQE
ncbi:maleylpyruvate isomerase family mycothiol-dependent enzyme [Streptomyces sp. UNOB3_S3]|uniref:maleylpyruvate isomerase family mycothiol-dependent enzyme n=1 Tax=Streptomyces sp. UNOB3_S3 TaxID=2871682 RepID=UPI001E5B46C8|nr:maleylpyruvate isomerase family mycothiol-dependent enzyme [Streptomyces sp. UNOB3_S3]MCC3775830.1 maleylpyruvate isomerase family mycothiol-dependent enzyme [Streptomyces sp. UNOB3_S3]